MSNNPELPQADAAGNPADDRGVPIRTARVPGDDLGSPLRSLPFWGAVPATYYGSGDYVYTQSEFTLVVTNAQQLAPLCDMTDETHRFLLEEPGHDVVMLRSGLDDMPWSALEVHEVNALLLASRGAPQETDPCMNCRLAATAAPDSRYPTPFVGCVRLEYVYEGDCAACIWNGRPCNAPDPSRGYDIEIPRLPPYLAGLGVALRPRVERVTRLLEVATNTGHRLTSDGVIVDQRTLAEAADLLASLVASTQPLPFEGTDIPQM